MLIKPVLASVLSCAVAGAQSCPVPFAQPVVPSLPTYISSLQSPIAAMRAQAADLPQPKIQLDGQNVYGVAGVLETGQPTCNPYYPPSSPPSSACEFDNYLVQRGYLQALKNAGVQTVDINLGMAALSSAPEYTTAWHQLSYGSAPIATQCGTGQYLSLGYPSPGYDTVPAGATFYCKDLAVIDDMVYYANSIGLKVRLAPTPGGEVALCGLPSTPAASDLEKCYDPLYYAAVLRWNGTSQGAPPNTPTAPGWIDSFTVIHEPDGVWGDKIGTLIPSAVNPFVFRAYAAILKAELYANITCPGSLCISVGAAIETQVSNSSEAGYWADWLAGQSGQPALNYMAQDVYPNTWDASVYASQGQWLCQASGGSGDTECPAVLIPCTPSALNDPDNECQWTVPSSITAQSGAVLASAVAGAVQTGAISGSSGTCPSKFSNGATATAAITSSAVSGLTVTNVGAGFTAVPATVTVGTSACTGGVTVSPSGGATVSVVSGTLANYAVGGALTLASGLARTAQVAGMPVRINEANRPVWVASGCPPTNANGVYDPGFVEWQSDGTDVAWLGAFTAWAAANGYTSISPFNTQIFSWYNSWNIYQCTSGCPNPLFYEVPFFAQVGYATGLGVATPAQSFSGAFWQQLSGGSSASLQGQASLQGASHLGH